MNKKKWIFLGLMGLILGATHVGAEETVETFDTLEPGLPPQEFLVIDGNFAISEHEDGQVLKLLPDPLVECGLLLGNSAKGAMSVEGKVWAAKRGRRSYPRFGLGIHGISGHRVRVVPAQKQVELVSEEEVIATASFSWESERWCHLRIALAPVDGSGGGDLEVKVWTWMAGEPEPEKPLMVHAVEEGVLRQGKASVWGTPYSGKEMLFDDVKITRHRDTEATEN